MTKLTSESWPELLADIQQNNTIKLSINTNRGIQNFSTWTQGNVHRDGRQTLPTLFRRLRDPKDHPAILAGFRSSTIGIPSLTMTHLNLFIEIEAGFLLSVGK